MGCPSEVNPSDLLTGLDERSLRFRRKRPASVDALAWRQQAGIDAGLTLAITTANNVDKRDGLLPVLPRRPPLVARRYRPIRWRRRIRDLLRYAHLVSVRHPA